MCFASLRGNSCGKSGFTRIGGSAVCGKGGKGVGEKSLGLRLSPSNTRVGSTGANRTNPETKTDILGERKKGIHITKRLVTR